MLVNVPTHQWMHVSNYLSALRVTMLVIQHDVTEWRVFVVRKRMSADECLQHPWLKVSTPRNPRNPRSAAALHVALLTLLQ